MIEVGVYGRTNKGKIFIFSWVVDDKRQKLNYILKFVNGRPVKYYLDEGEKIVKQSKNIIDLIEVGDIVEIFDVLNKDVIYIWNEKMLKAVKEDVNNGIKIRRILTKEQYEANCYKVEEE